MDVQIRILKQATKIDPDDLVALKQYVAVLERRLDFSPDDDFIEQETSVEMLRKYDRRIRDATNTLEKAIDNRIDEIQKSCKHEFGPPLYGIYIHITCKLCGFTDDY